jgi:uncharacterized protein YegP (UPF0339 family)
MGKFVISKTTEGKFKFDLVDDKGNIILVGKKYLQKSMCKKGIESVKDNSQDKSKYKCKRTLNNKTFFNLKSINGKIIGTSQIYEGKTSRDEAIAFIKSKVPTAAVEDHSKITFGD